MSGRYTLTATSAEVLDHFGAVARDADQAFRLPRYNVAPMQTMPIVRQGPAGAEVVAAHWGLIPYWAKDASISAHLINARADTVAIKPAFKAAFKRRRCLVPADGFYAWKTVGAAPRGPRQPYRFVLKSGGLFAFAGLWDRWTSPQGETVESFTIITTESNATVRTIDERMPVIVAPAHYARWLGIKPDPAYALTLIEPTPNDALRAVAVSTTVNNAAHDSPACVALADSPATT